MAVKMWADTRELPQKLQLPGGGSYFFIKISEVEGGMKIGYAIP